MPLELRKICIGSLLLNSSLIILLELLAVYHLWCLEPGIGGFHCGNRRLMCPYKLTLIPRKYLYLFVPFSLGAIIMLEWYSTIPVLPKRFFKWRVPQLLYRMITSIGLYLFGHGMTHAITAILKYHINELKPHFMGVCSPNVNCSVMANYFKFFQNYTCLKTTDKHVLRDLRTSFPSLHGSLPFYNGVFLAIFIQYKIPGHFSYFLKPFIQVVVLTLGLLVPLIPLSACNDYWPDISCGMLIGFFTAYANAIYVGELDQTNPEPDYVTE